MKHKFIPFVLFVFIAATASAQNVGIGTNSPGTKLDVTGAVTYRDTTLSITGNTTIPTNNHSQVVLAAGTGLAGGFNLTPATAPNTGEILVIYNKSGYTATLQSTVNTSIPTGVATQFVYTSGGWIPTAPSSSSAVATFSGGSTGLTPSSATSGAITLAGTLAVGNGGTGIATAPTNGQLLIGNSSGGYTLATLTGTSNEVTVTNASGSITLATPQGIGTASTPTFGGLTLSNLTAGGIVYANTSGVLSIATGANLPSGSGNYIQNTTSQQASSNFNISGAGVIGTTLGVTGNATVSGGTFSLNNSGSNVITYTGVGAAVPSFTTTSVGTKILLWPQEDATDVNYSIGIAASTLWYAVPQATSSYLHAFYGGTTELMRIRGDGRVGIGTTAPATNLHIYSSNANGIALDAASGGQAYMLYNGGSATASGTMQAALALAAAANSWSTGSIANDLVIRTQAASQRIMFNTNGGGATTMTVSAGNVGIGTTGPAYELDVTNPANANADLGLTAGTSSTSATTGVPRIQLNDWYNGSKTTSEIVYDFYGSYYSSSSHGLSLLSGRSGYDNIWFRNASGAIMGGFVNPGYSTSETLVSTDNLIVGGSVGIGTAGPTALLDVTNTTTSDTKANFLNTNTSSGNVGLELRTASSSGQQYIDFTAASTSNTGTGTPDYNFRMISNSTSFNINSSASAGITLMSNGRVGITNTPGTSAILDLTNSGGTFGLQLPKVTATSSVSTPTAGMVVYNSTANCPEYYNGSSWQYMGGTPSSIASITGATAVGATQKGVTYSVPSLSGATYSWSVTGSGTGAIAGSSTGNSINVGWSGTVGTSVTNTINVTVTSSTICGGSATATLSVTSGGTQSYTSGQANSWTVPGAVSAITVSMQGGTGGGAYFPGDNPGGGSNGGLVNTTITSGIAGQTLYIAVGMAGGNSYSTSVGGGGAGGYGNDSYGGSGDPCYFGYYGGGGGGASDIRIGGTSASNRVLVAGGGGGGGISNTSTYWYFQGGGAGGSGGQSSGVVSAGNGGYPFASSEAGPGASTSGPGAAAAGQYPGSSYWYAPGAGSGSSTSGGHGGNGGEDGYGNSVGGGGGGGGGYYGGGGGASGGGGGGASYIATSGYTFTNTTTGTSNSGSGGNGFVTITW